VPSNEIIRRELHGSHSGCMPGITGCTRAGRDVLRHRETLTLAFQPFLLSPRALHLLSRRRKAHAVDVTYLALTKVARSSSSSSLLPPSPLHRQRRGTIIKVYRSRCSEKCAGNPALPRNRRGARALACPPSLPPSSPSRHVTGFRLA